MNDAERNYRQNILGKNIEKARKKCGFSRKEIAHRLNMTETAFGAYERGIREPSISKLVEIAKILEVPVEELITVSSNIVENNLAMYRYNRAVTMVVAAAFSPSIGYDGKIELYLPPENDERRNKITFDNQQKFVDAIESMERTALYFNITFLEAFKNNFTDKISPTP